MSSDFKSMFLGMPRPSKWWFIFNSLMFAAGLYIYYWLGNVIGLFIGMAVASAGWIWFFIRERRRMRGMRCQICGYSVINLGRPPTPIAELVNIAQFFRPEFIIERGMQGPGDECMRCGRIYCTSCAKIHWFEKASHDEWVRDENTTCVCGSKKFRTVRLKYK